MAELKFLDDLAKFGNNTITAVGGFQKQVGKWVAEQTTVLVKSMDLATREDIQGYKNAAEAANQKIAELEARLQKLEAQSGAPKAKTAKAAEPEATVKLKVKKVKSAE